MQKTGKYKAYQVHETQISTDVGKSTFKRGGERRNMIFGQCCASSSRMTRKLGFAHLDEKNGFNQDGDDSVCYHHGYGEVHHGPTLRGSKGQIRNILITNTD